MNAKKPENHQWLETLLSANPAEVVDDGFSAKVMADIKRQEKSRTLVLAPFFIAAFGLLFGFFPYEIFDGLTGTLASGYKPFLPYLVPAGAAILMFLFSWFTEEVV